MWENGTRKYIYSDCWVLPCLRWSYKQKMAVFVANNSPASETAPRSTWWGSSATLQLDIQVSFTPETPSLVGKVRLRGGRGSFLGRNRKLRKTGSWDQSYL